jgi:hypothetical protein
VCFDEEVDENKNVRNDDEDDENDESESVRDDENDEDEDVRNVFVDVFLFDQNNVRTKISSSINYVNDVLENKDLNKKIVQQT